MFFLKGQTRRERGGGRGEGERVISPSMHSEDQVSHLITFRPNCFFLFLVQAHSVAIRFFE